MDLLTFERVGKRFADGTQALEDVSLNVPRRRVTVLLGASGCGKTTLLRLAAGLDSPTGGAVHGADATLRIGFVFQAPALMPWATVAQNVALPFAISGAAEDGRVAAALERVGLGARAQARPHQLSGGMQMRVSIARALVAGASLLLLDEPFAALDEVTRFDLQQLIADLVSSQGITALLVTHSVSEAVFLADQLVLMAPQPGRIARTWPMPADRPRGEAWRRDGAYVETCAQLSAALRATMRETGA